MQSWNVRESAFYALMRKREGDRAVVALMDRPTDRSRHGHVAVEVMAIFLAVACGGAQFCHPRGTTKPAEVRFRALLIEADAEVLFHREALLTRSVRAWSRHGVRLGAYDCD